MPVRFILISGSIRAYFSMRVIWIRKGGGCEMNKISYGEKCPYCKKIKRKRIPRLFWMKLLLFTKYYFCDWCGATYFSIFKLVSLRRYWPKDMNQNIGLCLNLPFQFSRLLQLIANEPQWTGYCAVPWDWNFAKVDHYVRKIKSWFFKVCKRFVILCVINNANIWHIISVGNNACSTSKT